MIEHTVTLDDLKRSAKAGDLNALQRLRDIGFFEQKKTNGPATGYPASHAQLRLWLLDRIDPGLAVYNMPAAVALKGSLDEAAFAAAFDALIQRHETLRTTFTLAGEGLLQVVAEKGPALTHVDLRADADPHARAVEIVQADAVAPFDLAAGPLVRAMLLRVGTERWVFSCNVHHIVCDEWSQDIMLSELLAAYESGSAAAPAPVQYRHHAARQLRALGEPDAAAARTYWSTKLAGTVPLRLPSDRPRPAELAHAGANFAFELDAELTAALRRIQRDAGATPFQLLAALVKVLLHRYSGQDDIAIGTPVSGRDQAEFAAQIGVFVNTLVLRDRVEGAARFADLLAQVRATAEEAYAYGSYPFDLVLRDLEVEPALGRSPLFDVAVVFQEGAAGVARAGDVAVSTFAVALETAKFDLTFYVGPSADATRIVVNYRTDLFGPETIERMAGHLQQLAREIVARPGAAIAELEIVTPHERRELAAFNDTRADYPDASITGLFDQQVAAGSQRVAVVAPGATWTYRQLDEAANGIAWSLRERFGVRPGDLVAVLLQPSEWGIAALLGVLKAGAAYVPLDPIYPPERLAFMLRDSQARLVITDDAGRSLVPDARHALVAGMTAARADAPAAAAPADLAYVIYTSGSTGTPKGCCIEHRNVVRLLRNSRFPFAFGPDDTWIVAHSLCFDFSVWEMYGALLNGGRLIVPERDAVRDPDRFWDVVNRERVTVLNQTPAAFANFIAREARAPRHDLDAHLRYVIFGGDRLDPVSLRPWTEWYPLERVALVNMYGITETTVHVTFGPLRASDVAGVAGSSPIGVPLPETTVAVRNPAGRLQPIGVSGEMYVGGSGVCRGYLDRPELTGERFLDDPERPGERVYRTGDLGRWSARGTLEHLGRNDAQVQVRGFRVETGDVQARLLSYPQAREVAVLARQTPDRTSELVAYLVTDGAVDVDELRRYVGAALPEYMVPAHFVTLSSLPLTANNKLDTAALPDPSTARMGSAVRIPPRDRLESALAAIWSRVLAVPVTSVEESYFNLGGDSIKVIRLINEIASELGVRLAVKDVFRHPTIAELARDVRRGDPAAAQARARGLALLEQRRIAILADPVLRDLPDAAWDDVYPMSEIQKGMVFHSLLDPAIYLDQFVYELSGEPFDAERLQRALRLLVEKHAILRVAFSTEGEAAQIVWRQTDMEFGIDDWSALDAQSQSALLRRLVEDDRSTPFDLARPGLWRMRVMIMEPNRVALLWVFHHAIFDGWSNASFFTELFETYFRLRVEPGFRPAPLLASYADFVADQLYVEDSAETAQFWQSYLAGYEKTPLPLGKTATAMHPTRQKHAVGIDPAIVDGLLALAHVQNAPVREVYLAAFQFWLAAITGKRDVLFGLVGNSRPAIPDGDRMVGCFLNSVPFRHAVDGCRTPRELIRLVHENLETVRPHERLAMGKIAELAGAGSNDGNQLLNVLFNFIDFYVLGDLEPSLMDGGRTLVHYSSTNTPFDVSISGTFGVYRLSISYLDTFFADAEIARLAGYFIRTLEQFVRAPDVPLETPAVLGDEAALLVQTFNPPQAAYPRDAAVPELFEAHAQRTPGALAVEFGERRMTYAELDERANGVAHTLLEYGLRPEELVAIRLERSEWAIVAMLGILKAGGAYVPLDPNAPAARIELILRDACCRYVISDGRAAATFDGVQALDIERLAQRSGRRPDVRSSGSSLAYVIYTSGSTGAPKGSLIEHRSIVRLVRNTNYVEIDPADRILQGGSIAFDACTFEIWGALLNGACVVMAATSAVTDPERFATILEGDGVSVLFLTTSLFNQFAERDATMFCGLRVLMTGGERASPEHFERVRRACPRLDLLHVYGPTENTTFSTFHRVREAYPGDVPIGASIAHSTVHILDEDLQLLPLGVPGEICTGGDGVARGYLNDPALTQVRFAPDPFAAGGRLYRTGDLGRRLADGAIQFLGRLDGQVKVRGFRVEPGEIEAVLQQHPAVGETIVVATPTSVGTMELAAYYTTRSPLEPAELRAYLAGALPAYMVPAHLIVLEAMPIAFTGKIDRRALPPPGAAEPAVRPETERPRDEREALLAQVWGGLLGRERIGIYEDYFELGGDSIKSIQMSSRLRQAGWKLEMRDLFEHPQIVELAPRLRPLETTAVREPVTGTVPLTPVQQWFFEEHSGSLDHFNMSMLLRARGPLDEGALRAALQAVWDHHDALRLTYRPVAGALEQAPGIGGPVHLEVLDPHDGAQLGQTLNLRSGPLFKAALLRSAGEDHLLLVFHHLVVDAVSLRIIIEDLERAYRGLSLPAPTDSFQHWARHLVRWAQTEECAREADYWAAVLAAPAHELARDRAGGSNRYGDCGSVEIAFPADETASILAAASAGFDVPGVLLTALGRALRARHGGDATLVLLEGHGREPLERGLDVDRTTGWFTTMFPFRLDVSGADPRAQLERVDENLRGIPRKGIGFGVARYLGPVDVQQRLGGKLPAIAFNYLGEFVHGGDDATFALRDQGPGAPVNPALQRRNVLDVVGVVIDKSLRLSLTFSVQQFERATIEQFAAGYRAEIQALVEVCAGAPRSRRPARARFAGVNEADLADILGEPR